MGRKNDVRGGKERRKSSKGGDLTKYNVCLGRRKGESHLEKTKERVVPLKKSRFLGSKLA